ncbi:NAD(P)/FAD-dependent oxidoreductase [Nonomuraea purpurea]|uniref:NAD(P)/FAD-dependent oxidoreductase n=1 Tax=Nonomuraea purpurea TaxID=1849276 RepID=A0ABV8GPU0_9ACTN
MYDVIVVGARCAGASIAMLLSRQGRRVLLLDRAGLPADTVSTLLIQQPGLLRLHQWGLLDDILATGAPVLSRASVTAGAVRLTGTAPVLDPTRGPCAPRRYALDQILLDAAIAAGALFRPRANVSDLHWDGGRVAGVVHTTPSGRRTLERATLVIGADGRHSTVAKLVGAAYLRHTPPVTRAIYTYYSGLPQQGLSFYSGVRNSAVCLPTQDGLTLVNTTIPHYPANRDVQGSREEIYRTMIRRLSQELHESLAQARRHDRLYYCTDLPNFFRQPYGPGWVLAGDAAHHKDPLPATGISDAFAQADQLACLLTGPLDDHAHVAARLAGYADYLRRGFTPTYERILAIPHREGVMHQAIHDNQHNPHFVNDWMNRFAGLR